MFDLADGRGIGRIRLRHIPNASAATLIPFIEDSIEPGSAVHTHWLLGTHQGSVAGEHLQDYLNEFAFRFNRRKSRSRGKLFYRLMQQAVAIEPTTYRQIVDSASNGNSPQPQPVGAA